MGRVEQHELDMLCSRLALSARRAIARQKAAYAFQTDEGFARIASQAQAGGHTHSRRLFGRCAEGPKDIKDSVTQAGAAAARAQIVLNAERLKVEAIKRLWIRSCAKAVPVRDGVPYGAILANARPKQLPRCSRPSAPDVARARRNVASTRSRCATSPTRR